MRTGPRPTFWTLLAWATTLTAAGVAAGFILFARGLPVSANFQDWLTLIDGARRLSAGQIPHVDFQSLIGPLPYLLIKGALALNQQGGAFLAAHGLAFLGGLPALGLIWRHSEGWQRCLAIVLFATMMLAPFNIDQAPACLMNYNGTYNRWGGALLLALIVGVSSNRRWSGPDLALATLALLAMLGLKLTVALGGFGVIICALLGRRLSLRDGAILFGSVLAMLALLDGATGMFRGLGADIAGALSLNDSGGRNLIFIGAARYGLELLLMVAAIAATVPAAAENRTLYAVWRIGVLLAVFTTDAYAYGNVPLVPALGLFLSTREDEDEVAFSPSAIALTAALSVAVLLPYARILSFNSACLAKNALSPRDLGSAGLDGGLLSRLTAHREYLAAQPAEQDVRMRASVLGDEAFHRDPAAQLFAVRAAAAAAQKLTASRPGASTYRVLDFADPFPALLGWVQPPGGPVTLHVGRTVGQSYHPVPARFLKVDVVLVPTCSLFRDSALLVELYKDELARAFRKSALTPCWDLYEREAGK